MDIVTLVFVCLLSDGTLLYQDQPCANAPAWVLDNRTVLSQRSFSVITSPFNVVAEAKAQQEIARADKYWLIRHAEIERDTQRRHESAIVETLSNALVHAAQANCEGRAKVKAKTIRYRNVKSKE